MYIAEVAIPCKEHSRYTANIYIYASHKTLIEMLNYAAWKLQAFGLSGRVFWYVTTFQRKPKLPWSWKPKRRYPYVNLHGVISKKIRNFISKVVRNPNLAEHGRSLFHTECVSGRHFFFGNILLLFAAGTAQSVYQLGHGWRNFLRARAKILYEVRRNLTSIGPCIVILFL
jgi:hypothetical protein